MWRQIFLLGIVAVVLRDGFSQITSQKPVSIPTNVYPISRDDAYRILSQSNLPDFAYYSQCGILIHIYVEQSSDHHSVTWHVKSSGHEMLSFSALITKIDASHSKIDISVPFEQNGREAYDGTQDYDRPAVLQPIRPAIEAQISSLLNGNNFVPPLSGEGRMHNSGIIKTFPNNLGQKKRFSDEVCIVQRASLGNGVRFRYDDIPGMDADESRELREGRHR